MRFMSQHVIDPYTGIWSSAEVSVTCMLFAKSWRIPSVVTSSMIECREGMDKSMNKAMTVSCSAVQANCMPESRSA